MFSVTVLLRPGYEIPQAFLDMVTCNVYKVEMASKPVLALPAPAVAIIEQAVDVIEKVKYPNGIDDLLYFNENTGCWYWN